MTQALKPFGMDPEVEGLYFIEDREIHKKQPSLFLALEIAERYGADAVYLRFFEDVNRLPKPEVYVYYQQDFSPDSEAKIKERIRKVWNAGFVQQCYFFSPTEAKLYNGWEMKPKGSEFLPIPLENPFRWNDPKSQKLIDQFQARLLDTGLFWETAKGKSFKQKGTAYHQLLESVKGVRAKLVAQFPEQEAIVKRLLVMTILLRYLEDRGGEQSALKPKEFFPDFCGKLPPSLGSVFRNEFECLKMFKRLAEKDHLNGEIFHLLPAEIDAIKKLDLEYFAKFAEGDISWCTKVKNEKGQLSLWKWYSFDDLPIELISHIYEDFAVGKQEDGSTKAEGVVYTPPQLVQFLLDEVLPLNNQTKRNPRILDPACGSGIFLVGAYKRLIQLWRLDNAWKKPSKKEIPVLQKLLKDCIFGCDINTEATRLTYFSLSLALLDALSPNEIWENVHFENLTSIGKVGDDFDANLYDKDFFKVVSRLGRFDLIIGNPPFLSELTEDAETVASKLKDEIGLPKIPDNQIALLFLAQSLEMLEENGKCCLVLPSGPLLYNNGAHGFRRYLIERHKFRTIFDFTPLRSSLFSSSSTKAKPAVIAAIIDNSIDKQSGIAHVIIRKNSMAEENVGFETDTYDIHWVYRDEALDSDRIWQANFMGGGRLAFLVKRFAGTPSFGDFLLKKEKEQNWVYGEGWQLATAQAPNVKKKPVVRCLELADKENRTSEEELEVSRLRKSHEGTWITGNNFLETEFLTINGIDNRGVAVCSDRFFHRPRTRKQKIFAPPHLLMKEGTDDGGMFVGLTHEYLTFKDKIVGIHCPWKELDELYSIEKYLRSPFQVPLLWLFSGQVIGNREGVPVLEDILALPYPPIKFYAIEEILLEDITKFQIDFRKNGTKSKVLEPIADPNDQMLQDYQEWYLKVLNSVYKDFKPTTPIFGNGYIGFAFYLGDEPRTTMPKNSNEFEQKVMRILHYQHSHQLYVRRILTVFEENVVFIFKPNQKRYWTRSIAIMDADETFAELFDQGY
ncbi:MAG: SAM-dependent DNA methyltransferase [Bacteroidetes bacterium]|nr:SAM-dependent DNA methyltransferase [Bacteroidota bacterium]